MSPSDQLETGGGRDSPSSDLDGPFREQVIQVLMRTYKQALFLSIALSIFAAVQLPFTIWQMRGEYYTVRSSLIFFLPYFVYAMLMYRCSGKIKSFVNTPGQSQLIAALKSMGLIWDWAAICAIVLLLQTGLTLYRIAVPMLLGGFGGAPSYL